MAIVLFNEESFFFRFCFPFDAIAMHDSKLVFQIFLLLGLAQRSNELLTRSPIKI
jgi:hypothetical protein